MISSFSDARLGSTTIHPEPFVDLNFPIQGKSLPAEHNYGLFAALIHCIPQIRQHPELSILSIPGIKDKQGKILLTHQSCLKLRVPISKIPLVYPLAGKSIHIGQHSIQIGIPQIYTLRPAKFLRARIVTIKGYIEPDHFIAAAQRQLDRLGIVGNIRIPRDRAGQLCRKTIKVQRFTVVGFTTEVCDLSDEDSIRLQQSSLGGKRHMGCGFFLPYKGASCV